MTWFLALVVCLPAQAQSTDGVGVEEDIERPLGTARRVPLEVPESWGNPLADPDLSAEKFRDLPFEPQAYRGAEQLGLEPEYVHEVRKGLDLLFRRQFDAAVAHLHAVDERFPGTAIGPVGEVLSWQAQMLENFDYEFDAEYEEAAARAHKALDVTLADPAHQGWDHTLMASMVGIEAIHTMRKQRYLPALQLALDAMSHAGKAREAAPEFRDLMLADGMYHYWRTVVTQSSRMLPDFGDYRVQGIEEMKEVERTGVFLAEPATLSLAFSYIEEGELKLAATACARNARKYPDNIVNNLVLGQVQTYQRRYADAMATFDHVLETNPANKRVRYWRGVTLLRSGHTPEAMVELRAYLNFEYLEDYQRSGAHYRLGQAYYRLKDYLEAERQYGLALKLYAHKGAKSALDRMKKMKKEGSLSY